MNLYTASNQWATRPADERFWTVGDLHAACTAARASSGTAAVPYKQLTAVARDTEVVLQGTQAQARLTHWAFGQLAQRAGGPASYLRTLSPALAAACINQGLTHRPDDDVAHLLFHRNGGLLCQAMLTEMYARIWNSDITARLRQLEARGWRVPPARPAAVDGLEQVTRPATAADVLQVGKFGLSINVGDPIAPAGLYASDHDLFVFMVREDRIIDGGDGDVLSRGFFGWNSEVGASSFGLTTFLYDHVCGNHIVWGASQVKELRLRHVGNAPDRAFAGMEAKLTAYADASVVDDQVRIKAAKTVVLGSTKDEILDRVFGLHVPGLSRDRLDAAYDLAVQHEDAHGDPHTVWGMVSGLTRLSQQQSTYTDERVALDRAAGKVLELAF